MNDLTLNEMLKEWAAEIVAENDNLDDARDACHEYADGSEHVIYYGKAHDICLNCDVEHGEQLLEEVGLPEDVTYSGLACLIAYGEIYTRLQGFVNEQFNENEKEE